MSNDVSLSVSLIAEIFINPITLDITSITIKDKVDEKNTILQGAIDNHMLIVQIRELLENHVHNEMWYSDMSDPTNSGAVFVFTRKR